MNLHEPVQVIWHHHKRKCGRAVTVLFVPEAVDEYAPYFQRIKYGSPVDGCGIHVVNLTGH